MSSLTSADIEKNYIEIGYLYFTLNSSSFFMNKASVFVKTMFYMKRIRNSFLSFHTKDALF